jgi:hypothetical protein
MSRARRLEEYVRLVEQMTERLEEWYDAPPEASFGEIEERARQERRLFMGEMLEVLINGRFVETLRF